MCKSTNINQKLKCVFEAVVIVWIDVNGVDKVKCTTTFLVLYGSKNFILIATWVARV